MQKSIQFLSALLAFSLFASAATALDATFPKRIAPDLVVESVEQGEFLNNPADPRHFKPSNTIGKKCGLFGWRMKVKTTRTHILVQEKGTEPGESNGQPMQETPKYGYLYSGTETLSMLPPGKYTFCMYVENVPVKTFTMTVK
jgi:hypothetical protein